MKRRRILLAGFALLGSTAAAQQPGQQPRYLRRGGSASFAGAGGYDIEQLAVLLDLDQYQKNEVERVLNEQGARRRVGSFEEMEAHLRQTRQETIEKLELVLTRDQLTKLELLMQGPPDRRVIIRSPQ